MLVAAITTAVVTGLSYGLPETWAATGVGLAFVAATYWAALRGRDDDAVVRHFGLSLGGLLERQPLDLRRMAADTGRALAWAFGSAAIVFPPFWIGYVWWWKPASGFALAWPIDPLNDVLGQLLVIALPEEAFYRGYLQTALDEARLPKLNVLGARIGWGLLISSALFAVGHLATRTDPNRLAVFFPALAFGWLRARTGGIGAAVGFHALCNLFAATLGRSYGLHG